MWHFSSRVGNEERGAVAGAAPTGGTTCSAAAWAQAPSSSIQAPARSTQQQPRLHSLCPSAQHPWHAMQPAPFTPLTAPKPPKEQQLAIAERQACAPKVLVHAAHTAHSAHSAHAALQPLLAKAVVDAALFVVRQHLQAAGVPGGRWVGWLVRHPTP